MTANQLNAVVDFIYYGEASVYEENIEQFLTLADELQLKGLTSLKQKKRVLNQDNLNLCQENQWLLQTSKCLKVKALQTPP